MSLKKVRLDVFNENGNFLGKKSFVSKNKYMIEWLRNFYDKESENIGFLRMIGSDFQNNTGVFFTNNLTDNDIKKKLFTFITHKNILPMSIYLSVRHAIKATWLNDRDQFLYPNKAYQNDKEFQSDCLAFMLFHGQNYISTKEGVNHFIPFSEKELGITQEAFKSDFMYKFINGKIKNDDVLFDDTLDKVEFSNEAKELLKAGKELFKYYHTHKEKAGYLVNASLYDIKEFFQGRDEKGKMNMPSKAKDEHYKILLSDLNLTLDVLAKKIESKIYEYGFLRE